MNTLAYYIRCTLVQLTATAAIAWSLLNVYRFPLVFQSISELLVENLQRCYCSQEFAVGAFFTIG
jgi:hypothetical protein